MGHAGQAAVAGARSLRATRGAAGEAHGGKVVQGKGIAAAVAGRGGGSKAAESKQGSSDGRDQTGDTAGGGLRGAVRALLHRPAARHVVAVCVVQWTYRG